MVANFSTSAVLVYRAASDAVTDFVALADSVTRNGRLGAAYQCVSVVVWRTAALRGVVDDSAAGAFSASFAAFARALTLVVDTRLIIGASVVAATSQFADSVLADLTRRTMIVGVADRFADSCFAAFVIQAV